MVFLPARRAGVWTRAALGFAFFLPLRRFLSVFLGRWPFLVLLVVY